VDRIAFIGDALMNIDPLWDIRCDSAFQAAAWLVNAVAPVPKQGQLPASALRRYAKKVSRHFGGHCFLVNDYAWRRGYNALERLTFSAAPKGAAGRACQRRRISAVLI
jgi:menaquinone-9 beta-reductase